MKKLLIVTLFATLAVSVQAKEPSIPQECNDYIEYIKEELSKKKDLPTTPKEIEEDLKGMETEFAEAVKLNGKEAVAKGCAELLKMMKEMNAK